MGTRAYSSSALLSLWMALAPSNGARPKARRVQSAVRNQVALPAGHKARAVWAFVQSKRADPA